MKDINEWYAEKSDVRLCPSGRCYFTKIESNPSGEAYLEHEWTINDPRCREIIREKFELSTLNRNAKEGKWGCGDESSRLVGHGKTIAKAEIACLTAIYEQELP